jgi:hypothetical protein
MKSSVADLPAVRLTTQPCIIARLFLIWLLDAPITPLPYLIADPTTVTAKRLVLAPVRRSFLIFATFGATLANRELKTAVRLRAPRVKSTPRFLAASLRAALRAGLLARKDSVVLAQEDSRLSLLADTGRSASAKALIAASSALAISAEAASRVPVVRIWKSSAMTAMMALGAADTT